MKELELVVRDGVITHIYDDDLAGLLSDVAESESTQRASHVEPDGNGGWTADLTPVSGPVLGPFRLRSEALEAEIQWLRQNM